tara:strand:+ start:1013 stop:1312 length:300 start_codon:yes stop_codon:yes gene_type:complete
MAITYTWDSPQCFSTGADQFIYKLEIVIVASDGTKEAVADISVALLRPETLIPFKDITKETTIQWAKDQIGTEEIENIEKQLKKDIDNQYSAITTAHSW